jgi:hypothetical protein
MLGLSRWTEKGGSYRSINGCIAQYCPGTRSSGCFFANGFCSQPMNISSPEMNMNVKEDDKTK